MPREGLWTSGRPRLHILDWGGEGAPLLLTHGLAGNVHWWDLAAPELLRGYRPAALDFRGHGDSDWDPEGRYDQEGFVEDIETARRALGWESMFLGGHSLGARLALEYARRRPERVAGLVVVDFLTEVSSGVSKAFQRTRAPRQPLYPSQEEILRRFRLEPSGTLHEGEALHELARFCVKETQGGYTWKTDWRTFLYRMEPVWPGLAELRLPTLIVRGERSEVMPREAFDRVVREVKGARGREIGRAYHHVPLDVPRELAEEMLSFLETL